MTTDIHIHSDKQPKEWQVKVKPMASDPEALSRYLIVGILARALVAYCRMVQPDGFTDFELVEYARETIDKAFVSNEVTF